MTGAAKSHHRPIRKSLEEYGRGVIGGLLVSLPMLYTMEVWWQGFIASPHRLLAFVAATFVLLLAYNRYAGMRQEAASWEIVVDSIEELGIGLMLSMLVLFLLGRIGWDDSRNDAIGKIIVEAMIVAVGVSIGTAQLGGGKDTGMKGDDHDRQPHPWGQTVIAFCGAVVFAANVAPTEEVPMIAFQTSPARLLSLIAFSILIGTITFFFSGFIGSDRHVFREGPLWIAFGIVTSYAAALAASTMMLWFFGRFDGLSLRAIVSQIVVLGFPAMLGASAGRLLIQGKGE